MRFIPMRFIPVRFILVLLFIVSVRTAPALAQARALGFANGANHAHRDSRAPS